MPYKPDSDCEIERTYRRQMQAANADGNGAKFTALLFQLNTHRKTCSTCQGVPLVEQLFGGKKVVVCQ